MNVFIDTNIFLSFYHFTSDDLEELNKLGVLLENKRVRLFLPQQVVHEFRRNRENKVADALRKLREQKLNLQFPQFCKDYGEYDNLRQLQRSYAQIHSDLVAKVIQDIQAQNLKADWVIQELFEHATVLPTEDEIQERARRRMELGNPPGKQGSLGDAINWEALLENVPNGEDIYFVTDDNDFTSPLEPNAFNVFLSEEWSELKDSNLIFYKSLSPFFKEHFPEISLASELEKDIMIRDLANSGSFAETHAIIAKLRQYTDFSMSQVNAIVQAAISNNQIYWIIGDWDVQEFLTAVIKGREEHIESESFTELQRLLGEQEALEEDDEIPF